MISKECLWCDFYDPDFECTCPSFDMWYACPISKEPAPEDFENGGVSLKESLL